MPAPVQDVFVTPITETYRLSLEPAQNNSHSLMLLVKAQKISGLSAWVTDTANAMTPEEKERHRLVMHGLYYGAQPRESWPSFQDYLDFLETLAPEELQEKILKSYARCSFEKKNLETTLFDKDQVMSNLDAYLAFLRDCFEPEHIDEELESQAYTYLSDPPRLKELIHSHLEHMWRKYLREEWNRNQPILVEAINAFQQVDISDLDKQAAFEFITGRPIPESWEKEVEEASQLTFVPSAHIGPYLGLFELADGLGVIFGARLPEGTEMTIPDLSRAEILVRLSALADDTRLQILKLTSEAGELRSKDIIERLDMSQSAASRHLSQLSATGLLVTRRCEGAKCYSINHEKITDTLNAVSAFLFSP